MELYSSQVKPQPKPSCNPHVPPMTLHVPALFPAHHQVILTRRHLAIVMTYEGGGDLHEYARSYKVNEEVAR